MLDFLGKSLKILLFMIIELKEAMYKEFKKRLRKIFFIQNCINKDKQIGFYNVNCGVRRT